MEKPFPAYQGTDSYVFVCYAHEDSAVVYPELTWLHEQGVNLWYDEGIPAGQNWRAAIGDSLLGADHILFYISRCSLESDHCNREINLALDEGKEVIPVYLEKIELTSDLKVGLNRVQALRLDSNSGHRKTLLSAIGQGQPAELTESPPKTKSRWMLVASVPVRVKWSLVTVAAVAIATSLYQLQFQGDQLDVLAGNEALDAMHSVAVLPFQNLSNNEENRFIAQGLTEGILDNLAQYDILLVASRTSTTQAVIRGDELDEVARELNVAYVLEGSVQRSADGIRITAQLIRASDNFHVWSKTYDQPHTDVFQMQSAVAGNIAHVLISKLDFDIHSKHGGGGYGAAGRNPRAVKLFLDGENQYQLLRLGEGGSWETYERLVRLAAAIDPNYFAAHRTLAKIYIHRLDGRMSYDEALPKALEAITSAKALGPRASKGMIFYEGQFYLYLDWNYPEAQAAFEKSLGIVPDCAWCYIFKAELAIREGRLGEARAFLETAQARGSTVREEHAILLSNYASLLMVLGEYARASTTILRARGLVAGGQEEVKLLRNQAVTHILMNDTDGAKALVAEAWALDDRVHPEIYVYLHAKTGDEPTARKLLAEPLLYEFRDHGWLSLGYLALGEVDKAVEAIRRGIEDHDNMLANHLPRSALFDELRTDPRFDALVTLLRSQETYTKSH